MTPSGRPGRVLAAVLPAVTIVTALVVGVAVGVEISLLVIAAGALAGVIALLWASVQALTGESPITLEEAMTLGAPSAEEEQKRSVLRALKDLEFERSVGKISEEDYAELSARYRTEAKRLMQLLDAGAEADRERAEKALRERLAKPPAKPEPAADGAEHADDKELPESEREAPARASGAEHAETPPSDATNEAPSGAESEEAS
ncbi:MAG TPA: hypothetical protein VMI54_05880 [Polyangiaceae bacterium]|nr:hypothetical protein [Polyangiaceae bacterium]